MKSNIFKFITLLAIISISFSACKEDINFTKSVFIDEDEAELSAFDKWLEDIYLNPYNLQFCYRMQDVENDYNYNLVPTTLHQSQQMAILVKYLWFDVYGKVASPTFLKKYGPRYIHLIGSAAYNPNLGTMILGLAEGGIKITLFRCNDLDYSSVDDMNEFYFKTMHHEFAHILHQQRTIPKEFETYSAGWYDPMAWQERTDSEAATLGFVSPYGSSQPREDFVEVIANYIVKTDEQWETILDLASKPGVNQTGDIIVESLDGKSIIETKLEICRKWFRDSWEIELDSLRAEVQERQLHIKEVVNQKYW